MHNHLLAARVAKVPENLIPVSFNYAGSGRKHLTLVRINSGREEANSR